MKEHEEVSFGLLYTILTDPQMAPKVYLLFLKQFYITILNLTQKLIIFYFILFTQVYRDLTFVSRDGLAIIVAKVHQILMEKFQKLLDVPKGQVQM